MSKVIVITGGSSGLGKEIAKILSNDNQVVILSKNVEELEKTAQEIDCEYYQCDVTDIKNVQETIDKVLEKHGQVDVLINNAGVWLSGDLIENTFEQVSNCIDVNTKGSIYMAKAILPSMYKEGKGLIVNVCSQASFDNDAFSPVYNASKWAMRGFNRSIQKDIAGKNIKVTGFYPGFMQTELFKKAGLEVDTSSGLEVEKVAKAVKFVVDCDEDVVIPELGIKDIENF